MEATGLKVGHDEVTIVQMYHNWLASPFNYRNNNSCPLEKLDMPKIAEEIDKFIQELKDKTDNKNAILYGINGHKILALMELKERLSNFKA